MKSWLYRLHAFLVFIGTLKEKGFKIKAVYSTKIHICITFQTLAELGSSLAVTKLRTG